jgi:hypothetical protein
MVFKGARQTVPWAPKHDENIFAVDCREFILLAVVGEPIWQLRGGLLRAEILKKDEMEVGR